jgi:bifunctional DNA-binding transcriptional regulator/antitoxin component of YhaV-PrlF toxin-antitoxin module
MYVNTISISSRGQIVLPKKVRDILKSDVISLEINEHNQVLISPIHNLGGSLSAYQKETLLPFETIRKQAWEDSTPVFSHKEG